MQLQTPPKKCPAAGLPAGIVQCMSMLPTHDRVCLCLGTCNSKPPKKGPAVELPTCMAGGGSSPPSNNCPARLCYYNNRKRILPPLIIARQGYVIITIRGGSSPPNNCPARLCYYNNRRTGEDPPPTNCPARLCYYNNRRRIPPPVICYYINETMTSRKIKIRAGRQTEAVRLIVE